VINLAKMFIKFAICILPYQVINLAKMFIKFAVCILPYQ